MRLRGVEKPILAYIYNGCFLLSFSLSLTRRLSTIARQALRFNPLIYSRNKESIMSRKADTEARSTEYSLDDRERERERKGGERIS